jgi:hypothetical protein
MAKNNFSVCFILLFGSQFFLIKPCNLLTFWDRYQQSVPVFDPYPLLYIGNDNFQFLSRVDQFIQAG